MGNKYWMGFGGCRFVSSDGNIDVTFPGAKGVIVFSPFYNLFQLDCNYDYVTDLAKYNADIFITKILNVEDNDYQNIKDWKDILNSLIGYNKRLTIYPKYDSDESDENNYSLSAILAQDDEININDPHLVKSWQDIGLHLISASLVELPGIFSDPATQTLDDESGVQITDHDGVGITVQDE